MNKPILFFIIVIAVFGGFYLFNSPSESFAYDGKVTVFKSMSCGCCSVYASYLDKRGLNVLLPQLTEQKLDETKNNLKIPSALRSCHTTMFGDYFVEGHIPLEAVEKLLLEKPDVAGIAMPGMPSGSPGMTGSKTGPFVIYAVKKDGTYSEFMRI